MELKVRNLAKSDWNLIFFRRAIMLLLARFMNVEFFVINVDKMWSNVSQICEVLLFKAVKYRNVFQRCGEFLYLFETWKILKIRSEEQPVLMSLCSYSLPEAATNRAIEKYY